MRAVRLLALSVLSLALLGGSARGATEIANLTTIELRGKAAEALREAGVRSLPVKPARGGAGRWLLPASGVVPLGRSAGVSHKGRVRLRAGKRTLTLKGLHVMVGPRSTLSAQVGEKRVTLLRIATTARSRKLDAAKGSVVVRGGKAKLTPAGARVLRRALGRTGIVAGPFATVTVSADVTASGMPPFASVDGPPTPGGASLTERPADAVEITAGSVVWRPRTSWLDYLRQGEGPSAEDGASFADNAYTFPIRGGWFRATDGWAVVETTGTARFRFTGHFIDSALTEWSYDLASMPKGVALIKEALHAIALPPPTIVGTRQPLMRLDFANSPATIAGDGKSVTWSAVTATLSNEGVPLYLAYPYGSPQGELAISAQLAVPGG